MHTYRWPWTVLPILLAASIGGSDLVRAQEPRPAVHDPWTWLKDGVKRLVGTPLDPRWPQVPPAYPGWQERQAAVQRRAAQERAAIARHRRGKSQPAPDGDRRAPKERTPQAAPPTPKPVNLAASQALEENRRVVGAGHGVRRLPPMTWPEESGSSDRPVRQAGATQGSRRQGPPGPSSDDNRATNLPDHLTIMREILQRRSSRSQPPR